MLKFIVTQTIFIHVDNFFPNKHIIEFTIVDMGLGFKKLLNTRFNSTLTSLQVFSYMHILFVFVPGDSFAEVKECEAANDCAQGVCTPIK